MDELEQTNANYLTPKQLASQLNLKPQTLAIWRLKHKGPKYVKFGRLIRYRTSDIEEWIAECEGDCSLTSPIRLEK